VQLEWQSLLIPIDESDSLFVYGFMEFRQVLLIRSMEWLTSFPIIRPSFMVMQILIWFPLMWELAQFSGLMTELVLLLEWYFDWPFILNAIEPFIPILLIIRLCQFGSIESILLFLINGFTRTWLLTDYSRLVERFHAHLDFHFMLV
jgi:hypothetical protein